MAGRGGGRFESVAEVLPPVFASSEGVEPYLGLSQKTRDFVERVRRIQDLADSVLVADVKDPSRVKLSTVAAASVLKAETGVNAIPVITARDSNRQAVASTVLTALSLGLTAMMLVWGDRYSSEEGARNVYDFGSLSEVIGLARSLAERSGYRCRLLAPVNLASLRTEKGLSLARERVRSGADALLAQPPTTDSLLALPKHATILKRAGLSGRVLLNVFPFRDGADIEACRKKFGWRLPRRLDSIAAGGEANLLREARRVAESARRRKLPGIYVSTRGRPELARFILD